MKEQGFFTEAGGFLMPADDDAMCVVREIAKRNKGALVHIHVPRNPRHHRLLFALLNEVREAGGWDGSTDTLLAWVKIATGHVEQMIGPKGKVVYIPKSISFGSMSQAQFGPFFDAAIKAICERLLSGADEEGLRQAVYDAVDGGYSAMRMEGVP